MGNKSRVLIIDDHKMVVEGIVRILELNETVEIIGWAATGKEGIRMVFEKEPDIVLLDIGLPDFDGVEVARNIYKANENLKIIVLSMFSSYDYILKLFEIGIDGFVVKDESALDLNEAISCVQKGQVFVSRIISDAISRMYIRRLRDKDSDLTRTEEKVLLLTLDGKNSREIAEDLGTTIRSVNTHKQNVLKKLNVTNEADLVKYSINNGILPNQRK